MESYPNETPRIDVPRVAFGVLLIALGTVLTVSNLQWLEVDLGLLDLWPLLFLAVGLSKLLGGDLVGGLVVCGVGAVFALAEFHPDVGYGDVFEQWPLFLVALGVVVVLRSIFPAPKTRRRENEAAAEGRSGLAIFRTVRARPETDSYRGDQLVAVIGGVDLDLERAALHPDGAMVEVFAFWGAIEIRVPRTWEVDVQVIPVMGGSEDKTRKEEPTPVGAPRLVVRGLVVMGGVEVHD